MKILAIICRILLGLIFILFGANGLHPFMHMPPMTGDAGTWMTIMHNSGWMTSISALQVLGGLLVLIGGTVPFGICILAPITVNILLFHFALMGGHGAAPGAFTGMLELVLIWAYRPNFNGILTVRATPVPGTPR